MMPYEKFTSMSHRDSSLDFASFALPSVSHSNEDSLFTVSSNSHGYGFNDGSLPCDCLPEPPEFDLRPPPKFLKFFLENSNDVLNGNFGEEFSCESENVFIPADMRPTDSFVDGTVTDGFGGSVTATDESSFYYSVVTLSVAAVVAITFTLCFLCFQKFRWRNRCRPRGSSSKGHSKSTVAAELDQISLAYSAPLTRKFDWTGEENSTSRAPTKSANDNGATPCPGFVVIRPLRGLTLEGCGGQPANFGATLSNRNDHMKAYPGIGRPLPNPPPYGTFRPAHVVYSRSIFRPNNTSQSLPYQDHHNLTYEEISLDHFRVECPGTGGMHLLSQDRCQACEPYRETGHFIPSEGDCPERINFPEIAHKYPINACNNSPVVACGAKNGHSAETGLQCSTMNGHFCHPSENFCRPESGNFSGHKLLYGQHAAKIVDVSMEQMEEDNPRFSGDSACCSCCGGSVSVPGSGNGSRPGSGSISDHAGVEPCHNINEGPSLPCKNNDRHVYDHIDQECGPITCETKFSNSNLLCPRSCHSNENCNGGRESGYCTEGCPGRIGRPPSGSKPNGNVLQPRTTHKNPVYVNPTKNSDEYCQNSSKNFTSHQGTGQHYHVIDPRFSGQRCPCKENAARISFCGAKSAQILVPGRQQIALNPQNQQINHDYDMQTNDALPFSIFSDKGKAHYNNYNV